VLQKKRTGFEPHYFDVWEHAHQGDAKVAEALVTISLYSYAIFVIFIFNSTFFRTLYGGIEEDTRARCTRPEVGPLRPRRCVCYRGRYPTWKVSEYINCGIKLSIVSL
jgi:hypothetical protein